jgi:molybdate-binding protein
VADAAGLGFVTLTWERFDLVVRLRDLVRPPFQALLECMRGEAFARRARDFGGYRLESTGRVRSAR